MLFYILVNDIFCIFFQIHPVVDVTAHSHAADTAKVQATKVMEYLKQEATVNRATPGQLMTDSTVNAAVGIRAAVGDPDVDKTPSQNSTYSHAAGDS